MIEIQQSQPRAIVFTSKAPGEPSPAAQLDRLTQYAEANGYDPAWTVSFDLPVPGRMMVTPSALRALPDSIAAVLFTEGGEPVAYPVRPERRA